MNSSIKTLFAFAAVATGVLAASCSKDDATVKEFTATMEQCTEEEGKTTLYNNSLYWQQGDQIKVYGSNGSYGIYTANNVGGVTTFTLTSGDPGTGPYKAFYPASAAIDFPLSGTLDLPAVQVSNDGSLSGFPMYATSNTSDLNFMNLCGVLRLRLHKSGVHVAAIEITSDVFLAGRREVYVSGGIPTFDNNDNCYATASPTKCVMLVCNTPQSINSPKDFYIYLPEHDYTSLRIRIYSSDGSVCTKTLNSGATISIHRGSIKPINLLNSLTFLPNAGRLNGLFSVSETKQVYFSQGNLQYNILGTHSTSTGSLSGVWHFAEDQWGYGVCTEDYLISPTYRGWIDLFRWGTSGWNSGAICYQPLSNSELYSDYYPGGLFTNGLTGEYAEADWAWHNAISNGGNAAHLWRTLTSEEWEYLFNGRRDASSKWSLGVLSGSQGGSLGLILLPDSWILPSGCTFVPEVSSIYDASQNGYTFEEWAQMEAAGAVFLRLPDAGVYSYWSSSPCDENNAHYIFSLIETYENNIHVDCTDRSNRLQVRPVRDYN